MFKKFLKFSIGGILSAFVSFASTPIISKLISPDDLGRSAFVLLAYNFLLQIVLLGIDQSYVREYYSVHEDARISLLKKCAIVPFLLSVLAAVLIILMYSPITIYLVGYESREVALLLGGITIIATVERFGTLSIRMAQKALTFSVLKVFSALATVCVTLAYATYISPSMIAIIYGNLAGLTITVLICILIIGKSFFREWGKLRIEVKDLIKYGLPFIPTFLIGWVFEAIDRIALKEYSTFHELGLYTAALKIVAVLTILQNTFSTFWTPIAFAAFEKDDSETKSLFSKSFQSLSAVFFLCALIVIGCKDIVIRLFSVNYEGASQIMPFLVFIPLMYTLSEITVGGINFKKKTHLHIIISVISAVLSIITVIILVPVFGARGAAVSVACSYLVFFYLRTYFSWKLFPVNFRIIKFTSGCFILFVSAFVNTFCKPGIAVVMVSALSIIPVVILYWQDIFFIVTVLKASVIKNKFTARMVRPDAP